jgi:hypothetical protein
MTYAALIFSHSITPRLHYIVNFLSRFYGQSFKLINDEENYLRSDISCKINYSYRRITGSEIWMHPHALLFESAIHTVKVECFDHAAFSPGRQAYRAFFKTEGDTGFDLLAAIFYLLSRYEEYLPHSKDAYGRYPHQNSLAFRENFLAQPLVNIWLEDFRKLLSDKNRSFAFHERSTSFLPTYDIDMAWSFRNKGFVRNAAAIAGLLLRGKWNALRLRIRVVRGKEQDPFDAKDWMDDLHRRYQLKPIYFFLVAKVKGKHDKNIDVDNREFRQLITEVASKYSIALHPSWASGDHTELLGKEKHWLEHLVRRPVDSSRQHYLRFELPATYRHLMEAGIAHDYSMGYGSINGFRASIACAYVWYDLKKETETSLLVHPFCFMDANAYYEEKLSAEEALGQLLQLYRSIQSVHGLMITIWHNSFLGTGREFTGWRETYEQFVKTVSAAAI